MEKSAASAGEMGRRVLDAMEAATKVEVMAFWRSRSGFGGLTFGLDSVGKAI